MTMPAPAFVRAADVPTAEFDDQLAVMDLRSGTYIAFNHTAAAVWKLLDRPTTADAIRDVLAPRYGVDPDRCLAEVAELLDRLREMKVIERAPA